MAILDDSVLFKKFHGNAHFVHYLPSVNIWIEESEKT
jgi:hypothetical protein